MFYYVTVALIGTHKDKSSALFWKIVTQHVQLQGNPVVCWKFLHVVHRLLRDGHPNVCATSAINVMFLSVVMSRVLLETNDSLFMVYFSCYSRHVRATRDVNDYTIMC